MTELLTFAISFIFLTGMLSGQQAQIPKSAQAKEMRLTGSIVSFPFVVIEGIPFIEANVQGVRGKLMLDTGIEDALTLNDHRIALPDAKVSGKGFYGSGQHFVTRMNAHISNISFGSYRLDAATEVPSQDASQLERITPDFLGWIGFDFWKAYAMKLDYRRNVVTFYRGGPEEYLQHETVNTALHFAVRKLPNHPILEVSIGSLPITAAFDTGQYGTLYLDEATKSALLQAGELKATKLPDEFDLGVYQMDRRVFKGISAIEVLTEKFPPANPIGVPEQDILTMGYRFLKQYKSVWDYRDQTIYLLKP